MAKAAGNFNLIFFKKFYHLARILVEGLKPQPGSSAILVARKIKLKGAKSSNK